MGGRGDGGGKRGVMTRRVSLWQLTSDIGQTEIAARIAIREPLVIESEQVEHRGVQIVDVHLVLDRVVAVIVGRAVGVTSLTPPPASHIVKPCGL